MMTPVLGFSPDIEAPTPGVLMDCSQFIPYQSGMESAPSVQTPSDVPALAAACSGAAVVTLLDGTRRILAGTTTKLYEVTAGSWADESRTVGGAYTGGSDSRWSFAQFGNSTVAANRADAMQRSTGSGIAFADIATAPKAEIVFSVGAFVMALNVDDGADKPDGWHCCAAYDETDWTASVTTQATKGRLVATPGELTAGLRLGDYAIAYKSQSIYMGQYVGSPVVWDWILVPGGGAGCVGKEAVCDIDGAHFFVGEDNFWLFDGTRPVPVGDSQIRQWFSDNSDPANLYKTKCVYDRQQNRVWIFYPSAGSSTCDSALVYHLKSKQFGRANRTVEAVLSYVGSGITYDTLSSAGATYDALPDVSYDSQYWLTGGRAMSIFNSSHQLQTLTGAGEDCTFTTGDVGDDDAVSLLKQVRVRFSAGYGPTTASLTTYHKMSSGDSLTLGTTTSINDGKFDVLKAARWHRGVFSMTGTVRVTGMNAMLEDAGVR